MKFRKRPVVVDAIAVADIEANLTDPDAPYLADWLLAAFEDRTLHRGPGGELRVRTLEGTMVAETGDWLIRGVKGEMYPCKADVFAATYEAVV